MKRRRSRERRKDLFHFIFTEKAEFDKADVQAHRREGCADVSFPLSQTLAADSMEQP